MKNLSKGLKESQEQSVQMREECSRQGSSLCKGPEVGVSMGGLGNSQASVGTSE